MNTTQAIFQFDVVASDVTARKHRGRANSVEAHESIKPAKETRWRQIEDTLRAHPMGLTGKEIAELHGVAFNAISGRFSEMKELGILREQGRRDKSAVLVLNPKQ